MKTTKAINKQLTEKKKAKPSKAKDKNTVKQEPADNKKEDNESSSENMSDEEKKNKILEFIKQAASSGSDATIASMLDNLTLGNFKDALCDVFKNKILNNKSEAELQEIDNQLNKLPAFEKAQKYQKLDDRKDTNTNTDIDPNSTSYEVLFYSNKPENNIIGILTNLATDIQKQAHNELKELEETKAKIKSLNIKGVGDSEVEAFGPIIAQMIKDGKTKDEISKEITKLTTQVSESYKSKLFDFKHHKILTEGNIYITEVEKKNLYVEAICDTNLFIDVMTRKLLEEGFFDKLKDVGKTLSKGAKSAIKSTGDLAKAAYNKIPQKYRDKIAHLKDAVLEKIRDGALAPILKIAGISLTILSGAWGIGLLIAVLMLIDKHGKQLKAAFEKQWTRFANSKGVITKMDFGIKDNPKLKYSARFYVKDMVWRVVNTSDQLKHQTKEFAKNILTGEIGKKYIERVNKIWDPVFSNKNGESINFAALLSSSKTVQISEKQLKLLTDFQAQYDKIKTALNKPSIDTRDQSMKTAVKA